MSNRSPADLLRVQAQSLRENANIYLAKADESRHSADEYDHWRRESLDTANAYEKAADTLDGVVNIQKKVAAK